MHQEAGPRAHHDGDLHFPTSTLRTMHVVSVRSSQYKPRVTSTHAKGNGMSKDETLTVFVVDSSDEHRNWLAGVLRAMQFEVQPFTSVEDAYPTLATHRRGMVLARLRLPGMSGLDLHERLKRNVSPLAMVLMSERVSTQLVVRAIRQGVVDFLDLPLHEDGLWLSVREALSTNMNRLAECKQKLELRTQFTTLSDSERAVLDKMCVGMTNKEIAKELDVSVRTVESRRRRMLEKTQIRSISELLISFEMYRREFGTSHGAHAQFPTLMSDPAMLQTPTHKSA